MARLRALFIACLLLIFGRSTATAQVYTQSTSAPQPLDERSAEQIFRSREIHEHFQRGLAAEATADWSRSINEFTIVIQLDPSEPRGSTAYYDLGVAQAHAGHDQAALTAFDAALRRDPHFAAAAANAVVCALHAGDIRRARTIAAHLLQIAPRSLLARYDVGLTALRSGDDILARQMFAEMATADPALAIAQYTLAVLDIRAVRLTDALAHLQRAVALAPQYHRARLTLGCVLLRLGRRSEAYVQLRICARADDEDSAVRETADAVLAQFR